MKKSLTLSGTYKDLTLKIREAESEEQLEELYSQIELETNVYNQRAKHLQNLFTQQSEFVKSANMNLSEVLAEVRTLGAKTVEELDF